MAEGAPIRLSKALRELNVGMNSVVDFLDTKGISIDARPNTKLDVDTYGLLVEEFAPDRAKKQKSEALADQVVVRETITLADQKKSKIDKKQDQDEILIKNVGGFTEVEVIAPEPVVEEKPAESEKKEEPTTEAPKETPKQTTPPAPKSGPTVVGTIDLSTVKSNRPTKKEEPKATEKPVTKPAKATAEKPADTAAKEVQKAEEAEKPKETKEVKEVKETKEEIPVAPVSTKPEFIETKVKKLDGPKFVGKIDLPPPTVKPAKKVGESADDKGKRKRKRISKVVPGKQFDHGKPQRGGAGGGSRPGPGGRRGQSTVPKPELTEEQIQNQVRETLAALKSKGKSSRSKYRRERREAVSEKMQKELEQQEEDQSVLKLTEFVTVSELATMMDVSPTEVISMCMSIGMMVSINQRLDSETLTLLAEEFGYTVEFVGADIEETIQEEEDDDLDSLEGRPPIVTVMGHVDHGKTSLLDHVRRENVIAGEAGGITQHIGAYSVALENGKTITFLDTPGHEAFTAMRARGAQVTDIAIIVIAADDAVMPQTVEAINHAQAAGVPMVFTFNKIDRDGANADKIREQLANMNILVEDWGGKYQCQEISAKTGLNIQELLEKVLLEAELLELQANPNKAARGTVIEATLDIGRGYTTTLLVQSGNLNIGDVMLAGSHFGRVKAMFNERGAPIETAGPSMPVSLLGMNGAPNAGDSFLVMEDEREAKNIAAKRQQLQREQSIRTQRRQTLEDIGEILQKGDYHELNLIIKGDVDGSVEALADSMLKLSTENIAINVIHKSVGQISESDVLLATASDAVIIGFQVRPASQARKRAEGEGIQIRLYSIIYDAINDMKAAMEGMLKPKIEEQVVCNIEVRETFKISKVGTIAGCYVLDGTISRNTKVRLIRDGIVQYTGSLGSLKRFKEDVKEVKTGFECGLNIENYNDIKVDDIIEGFEEVEVARKLE
ncbi:MAG: translation initiation factor IF-2 [Flavobacteriales bacterium]|jgi:translation initiation factor IF-2|nr:translation initiation factor IF-2 [Flavobacteriales bacterium]MBT5976874.1 translation initiation factor IF-2 [Flavobacteriales bacterium]MBT6915755.1 translation initiation factor IF-2 [Flavobacteriales bacterium]MBT6979165.1 translation initiation factor IF-2 [Flavobacteriales bacterium]